MKPIPVEEMEEDIEDTFMQSKKYMV